MNKRKVGERSGVLLSSLDLQIYNALKKKRLNVGELAKELNVKHKNLKPHIDLLVQLGFITATPTPKSREIVLSLSIPAEMWDKMVDIMNRIEAIKKVNDQKNN